MSVKLEFPPPNGEVRLASIMEIGVYLEEGGDTIAFATFIVTGYYLKNRCLTGFLTVGAIKAKLLRDKMNS